MDFWSLFLPQLIAAAIGVGGLWLAFVWQRNATAKRDFSTAASDAIRTISQYAYECDAAGFDMQMALKGQGFYTRPNLHAAVAAWEILLLSARKKDRPIAEALAESWKSIRATNHVHVAAPWLVGSIAMWVEKKPANEIVENLNLALVAAMSAKTTQAD